MKKTSKILPLFIFLFCQFTFASNKIQVAITFDDLPAAGSEYSDLSRLEIAKQIIKVLKEKNIPGVYGFANGILAKDMAERYEILKLWKEAGYQIGNHTFSHLDLSKVSLNEYEADIEKNESLLIDFASSISELKYFRYPFLSEGENQEKRYGIRSYLLKRKYKIAPVTIDFEDWNWGDPYIRCAVSKDEKSMKDLHQRYLSHAVDSLLYSQVLAKTIFGPGRPIKHVLLLHFTAINAQMLRDILNEYEKNDVQWISLKDALQDSIYDEDTTYVGADGKNFLVQAQITRKIKKPKIHFPIAPASFLKSICVN